MTASYWQRRNAEMKHIQDLFNSDAEYNRAITQIYRNAQREIEKEIDSFLQRYASREKLSMDEARKRISKMDVEDFAAKAKRYVEEKNFSPRANEELRAYNVKMRMNRLELLNQHIRLETIALANEEEKLLTARLDEEVYNEVKRQAGILEMSVPSPDRMRQIARTVVQQEFQGATFSERIWTNRAELNAELDNLVRRTLIQGENPRVGARKLRGAVDKSVKNKRYAAERLAITESARTQTMAQQESFRMYGIEQVEWIAEPDACRICAAQDGQIFTVNSMTSGSVTIPAHPHCRCSYSSYVDRSAWEADLTRRGL